MSNNCSCFCERLGTLFPRITDECDAFMELDRITTATFFDSKHSTRWVSNHWQIPCTIMAMYLLLLYVPLGAPAPASAPSRAVLVTWNALMALLSMMGAGICIPDLLFNPNGGVLIRGFAASVCTHASAHGMDWTGMALFAFLLSKPMELVDTLLLCRKGRPVTFLHAYHHSTVIYFTWYMYAARQSAGLWFASMNLFVHCIMYSYYAAASVGRRPPSSAALTITCLQISQMIMGCTILFTALTTPGCHTHVATCTLGFCIYGSYTVLFVHFFATRYVGRWSLGPLLHNPLFGLRITDKIALYFFVRGFGLLPTRAKLLWIALTQDHASVVTTALMLEMLAPPATRGATSAGADHQTTYLRNCLQRYGLMDASQRSRVTPGDIAAVGPLLRGTRVALHRQMYHLPESITTGRAAGLHRVYDAATPSIYMLQGREVEIDAEWNHMMRYISLASARQLSTVVRRVLKAHPSPRIIDWCGGAGDNAQLYAHLFPEAAVTVVDLPQVCARVPCTFHTIPCDLHTALPALPRELCDAVFMIHTIREWRLDQLIPFFKWGRDALADGGVIVMNMVRPQTLPQHPLTAFDTYFACSASSDQRSHSAPSLRDALISTGFENVITHALGPDEHHVYLCAHRARRS